jgi:hypothetical protein
MIGEQEHEQAAPEIEREVEGLRSDLGGLVDELKRRRDEATDVPLQLRRHSRVVAVVLGVAAASVIAQVVISRRRRAQRFSVRAGNLVRVLSQLSQEDPRRVRRAVEGRGRTPIDALARAGIALLPRLLGTRAR